MTCQLVALGFDANDPHRLARFWAGVLGWEMVDESPDGVVLLPNDDTGFRIEFFPTQVQKSGQNQMHFDLTSTSLEDNKFLADCGFIGALACDGSQEVGYFWHEALGWPLVWDQDQETAIRSPHGGPKITWGGPPLAPKTGKYRLHFDIAPPFGGDQQAEVDRLVSLGATRIDIGQGEVNWVVMADPDGHEFCVLTPR